jgi:hypothetical protein
MAARVLGHASKAEQARRLMILRELWPTDRPVRLIAERIGLCESGCAKMARAAGLPPRRRDARVFSLTPPVAPIVSAP